MSTADSDARSDQHIGDFDVAVIGGGIAGCYTAWRLRTLDKRDLAPDSPLLPLLKDKARLDVGLFEYSDRLGGRLWSAALRDMPEEFAEFGGMRFYKEMHVVWNLIETLGLAPRAIPFPVGDPHNLVYVRGRHLRSAQLGTADVPYRLRYLERGKTPDQLTDLVSDLAVAGFVALRRQYSAAFAAGNWEEAERLRKEYDLRKQSTRIDGRTVYDMSWWELQARVLSYEAFEFILETGGYDVTNTNGNAAHSLDQNFFTPEAGGFFRLSHGFDELPDKLNEVYDGAGGRTYLLHRLVGFDKAAADGAGGPYNLLFHLRSDANAPAEGRTEGALARLGERYVKARAKLVVLALPVRALRLLDQDNFFFRPATRDGSDRKARLDQAMDAVLGVDAFKLFLAYRRPWWHQAGVTKGQSVTDLPLRQCYYWATDVGGSPTSPTGTNSILMATYNNGVSVPFWQSLQAGPLFGPDPAVAAAADPFAGRAFAQIDRVGQRLAARPSDAVEPPPRPLPRTATRTMVAQAHAQLMEMHGVAYAPEPYDAHFQDWTVDPFGAGWHQWKTSTDENRLIPYMRQPLEDEQVFVVGECWSDAQGWVQGALNTSETMLQERLGLNWPAWLEKGGTWLGPRARRDG
jgi:lysine 2-monooxygenase